jgi:hypothetical protein
VFSVCCLRGVRARMDRLLEAYADVSPSGPDSAGIHVNFYDDVFSDDADADVVSKV